VTRSSYQKLIVTQLLRLRDNSSSALTIRYSLADLYVDCIVFTTKALSRSQLLTT